MNNFFQLCIDNASVSRARQESFVSNAVGQTLYIRGVIAPNFDANAADVIANLNKADPTRDLNIMFNTPGGDVFTGKEIAAAIENYPGRTVAHIVSLCASAGTSVAISCDEVVMQKGAFFMIHNAQGIVAGDKKVMRDRADLVEKIELSIVDDYTKKTGKPADEVIAMMDAETWMSAEEALAHGFIDRIAGESKAANTWNLSSYNKAPAALTESPASELVAPIEPAHPAPSMTQSNANRLALLTAL